VQVVAASSTPAAAARPVENPRARATPEQLAVFFNGVDAVLQQWTALNLVTQHHVDPQAALELRSNLREWFTTEGELYSDELEEFFEDFFNGERFASVEDGSLKEVGDVLHAMYLECCRNDDTSVLRYIASLAEYQRHAMAHCIWAGVVDATGQADPEDDDDEDEEGEDIDDEDAAQ
jgi:pre-rRNA-processing protein TSR2